MIARCVCGAVEYRPLNASSMTVACERRKVERPWAHNLLKLEILGSEVPRSMAVLCTESCVPGPVVLLNTERGFAHARFCKSKREWGLVG